MIKLQAKQLVGALRQATEQAAEQTLRVVGTAHDPKFARCSLIINPSDLDPDGVAKSAGWKPDLAKAQLFPRSGGNSQRGPTKEEVIAKFQLNALQTWAFWLKAVDHEKKLANPDEPGKTHLLVGAGGTGKSVVWEAFVYYLSGNGLSHTVKPNLKPNVCLVHLATALLTTVYYVYALLCLR